LHRALSLAVLIQNQPAWDAFRNYISDPKNLVSQHKKFIQTLKPIKAEPLPQPNPQQTILRSLALDVVKHAVGYDDLAGLRRLGQQVSDLRTLKMFTQLVAEQRPLPLIAE